MNSIQREINAESVANFIRLHGASCRGSYLIVEGPADEHLMKKFCSEANCLIVVALSRENVIGAILVLEEDDFTRALGLVDRDYSDFFPEACESSNIVYTEENDVEVMIMCSPALDFFLAGYGSVAKIKDVEEARGASVRELLFQSAAHIGGLRLISRKQSLSLKFSEMKYRFESNKGFDIDIEKQFSHVLGRSKGTVDMSMGDLTQRAKDLISEVENMVSLCSGHDCTRILGRSMKSVFGSDNQFDSSKGAKSIEKILRLAYEWRFFEQTSTCVDIREWENRNNCQVVLIG